VFYNLIVNAGEAIQKRRETDPSCESAINIRSYAEEERVIVTVTDTGVGIADDLRDRIFEPFFTTKETGKGKGLGLSIVQEIVRDYDGKIKIESESEKAGGTMVILSFPT
jgi:C4-dicarboxylate-specific signal transduction histidine kinase